MPVRVLLVHGWGGTHPAHWQNWLLQELSRFGIQVFLPQLPDPLYPKQSDWLEKIFQTMRFFDKQTILIGHSLGVPTILRILEKLPASEKTGAVFSVAGFARDLKIPQIRGFVQEPFDWAKIRKQCAGFTVMYSDNDPFIPVKESLFLARQLRAKTILQKNAGHLTAPDFGPFPLIKEMVLKETGL